MDICFITDSNYVIGVMTAIKSIELNCRRNYKINIHVLANNITDYEKKCISDLSNKDTEISVEDVTDKIPDISCRHDYVTKTSLVKFLLPEIFSNLDEILYFDDDVLALGDISKFENIEVSDVYTAAVLDIMAIEKGYDKQAGVEKYFNSGVMKLNLRKMREDKISEKLLEYKRNELSSVFMDQNTLNVILGNKIKLIDINYNYMRSNIKEYSAEQICNLLGTDEDTFEFCKNNIIILHMTYDKKPWAYILSSYFKEYLYYLLKLPKSNIRDNTIRTLYTQNPLRFIKYRLKCIIGLKMLIELYEFIKRKLCRQIKK